MPEKPISDRIVLLTVLPFPKGRAGAATHFNSRNLLPEPGWVDGGEVLVDSYHDRDGKPHAEIVAHDRGILAPARAAEGAMGQSFHGFVTNVPLDGAKPEDTITIRITPEDREAYLTGCVAHLPDHLRETFLAEAAARPTEWPTLTRTVNETHPDPRSWAARYRTFDPGIVHWEWADGSGFPPREGRDAPPDATVSLIRDLSDTHPFFENSCIYCGTAEFPKRRRGEPLRVAGRDDHAETCIWRRAVDLADRLAVSGCPPHEERTDDD